VPVFVTTMMATLAANARAAQAKTLGHAVPQVDRLAVRHSPRVSVTGK
jgi:hypothetical protein